MDKSLQHSHISQKWSLEIDDLKLLIMLGMIRKINRGLNKSIKKRQEELKLRMKSISKKFDDNSNNSFCFIEPENHEHTSVQQCKQYFQALKNSILKYLKKKKSLFKLQLEQRKKGMASKKLLTVKFQDQQNEDIARNLPISLIKKTDSINSDINREIEIRLNSEQDIKQEKKSDNKKFYQALTTNVKRNKYLARKKEQIYTFARLNKTLENFSQRHELTAAENTYHLFLKNLAQGKESLHGSISEIMMQKQECQVRITSYIDNLFQLIRQILMSTSLLIPNQHVYMNNIKKKIQNTARNHPSGLQSQRIIDLTMNPVLYMRIREFVKLCTQTNQILKEFLLSPFTKNLFIGRGKVVERVMKNVMEARYVFGYLQKQVDHLCDNLKASKSQGKKTKEKQEKVVKKKKQVKWMIAFKRKFLPKVIGRIRY